MKTLENTLHEWQPWIDMTIQGIDGLIEKVVHRYGKTKKTRRIVAALSAAKWHPANKRRGKTDCAWCCYVHSVGGGCSSCALPAKDKNKYCVWGGSLFENTRRKLPGAQDKLFWTLMEIFEEACNE